MDNVSSIFVRGLGAVSPAGWGLTPFRDAIARGEAFPTKALARPGWEEVLNVRQVPAPQPRPSFLANPRLRRTSPITQYAVASALEALGANASEFSSGGKRLGIIFCAMTGCVNYSRRFYDEALRDPATASPLVFPETVFNAPASHIAALLGTTAINYTIVGDPGTYLQGLALGADWLVENKVDGCLVIGAEEIDWLTADAYRLFARQIVLADGAGCVFLSRDNAAETNVELSTITDSHLFLNEQDRNCAALKMASELRTASAEILCDSRTGVKKIDLAEVHAWSNWNHPRLSPKTILGEGLAAASAWQCIAGVDAITQKKHASAIVSVVGCNQQAIGARFTSSRELP